MNEFPEEHNLSKLKQETKDLNSLIAIKETESVRKLQAQMDSLVNSFKHLRNK